MLKDSLRYAQLVIGYPQWMTGKTVAFYGIAFALCTLLWSGFSMPFRFAAVSIVSVLVFYFGGESFARRNAFVSSRLFVRRLFWLGFSIRLIWVVYSYFANMTVFGAHYGDGADVTWYMPVAQAGVEAIKAGNYHLYDLWSTRWGAVFDDMGYPFWLMVVYLLTGSVSDVFIPFLVKAAVSAYCAVCIYHVAQRHFGEDVARLAGIFTALFPHLIYWCGTMFKEAELSFLVCWFVDEMDKVISSNNVTFARVVPASLIGLSLFGFRGPLGVVAFLSVLAGVVMTTSRIMNSGKKVMAGVLVALVLFVGMGDRFRNTLDKTIETVQSSQQEDNMEWRAQRVDKGGHTQSFARYAGAVVFAPLIFTIPFPTFVTANSAQIVQMQMSGGNFIKNVCSFFVIFVLFVLLFSREWRKHVFILAFMMGNLVMLALSNFAQSGRFHIPVMPMLLLFAALGIKCVNSNPQYKRWFNMALFVEIGFCLFWNWFKLRGRGMI